LHGCADDFVVLVDVGLFGNGRLVEIGPVLIQSANDVRTSVLAADDFPDVERLSVFLLLVPFRLLLRPSSYCLTMPFFGVWNSRAAMFPGFSCARPVTAVNSEMPRIDASFFTFIEMFS